MNRAMKQLHYLADAPGPDKLGFSATVVKVALEAIAALQAAEQLADACRDGTAMLAVLRSGCWTDAGEKVELLVKWRSTESAVDKTLERLRAALAARYAL